MKNEKLYRARIDRHWSQEKAAEKIGVVRKTYIEWENGLRRPHISLLADIQKAFNMTPQQLGLYENEAHPQHATTTSYVQVPPMQLIASSQTTAAVADMFSAGIKALMAAQQQNAWTIEELRFRTEQEMTRLDAMARRQDSKKISRRYTLGFLIELPLALSGATALGSRTPLPLAPEEVLPLYVTSIPACWRLFFDGEVEVVENVLPTYISHLTAFAQQPSSYQRTAASLLSQTHQLGSRVSLEHEDFGSSLNHCKQAFLYGQLAEDANVQAGAVVREVDVLYYRKRHSQVASSIQKAVPLLNATSPLMRSRLYSELAAIQARPGLANKQSVERYLALSHEAFPDHPENDPSFLYTHTNKYIILLNEALARLHLDQPKQADTAIAAAEAYVPVLASTWGLELLRHQTLTAIALGDLERTQSKFEAVVSAGLQFGTSFWLNDARDLYYENILSRWPSERKVKDLEDLLH